MTAAIHILKYLKSTSDFSLNYYAYASSHFPGTTKVNLKGFSDAGGVNHGKVQLDHVPSHHQLADIFTKSFNSNRLIFLRDHLVVSRATQRYALLRLDHNSVTQLYEVQTGVNRCF